MNKTRNYEQRDQEIGAALRTTAPMRIMAKQRSMRRPTKTVFSYARRKFSSALACGGRLRQASVLRQDKKVSQDETFWSAPLCQKCHLVPNSGVVDRTGSARVPDFNLALVFLGVLYESVWKGGAKKDEGENTEVRSCK